MSLLNDAFRGDRLAWHPFTQHQGGAPPLPVVGAEGAWLHLADGQRVLDAIGSWWASVHGHRHPTIMSAIAAQTSRLDHVMFGGFTHEGAARLCERLVARVGPDLRRVFFSDDGSTAVEVALKMALQSWANVGRPQKRRFVALKNAYHGDTVGAMSVGDPDSFDLPFAPMLFPVTRVAPAASEAEVAPALAALEALFQRDSAQIAAMIVEPILQGAGGMRLQPPAWLAGVRALCDRHEVLLIADEVLTGFGRTGTFLAVEQAGITPDLLCLGKGLTGGALPMAVTVATERLFARFLGPDLQTAFLHGHTFTANPLCCAAALASLDVFDQEPVLARVQALEDFYAARLPDFLGHPRVAGVRWKGSLGVVELADPRPGYFSAAGPWLRARFLERGLLVRPLGQVVYTLPPYNIAIADLARVYDVLFALLDALP